MTGRAHRERAGLGEHKAQAVSFPVTTGHWLPATFGQVPDRGP